MLLLVSLIFLLQPIISNLFGDIKMDLHMTIEELECSLWQIKLHTWNGCVLYFSISYIRTYYLPTNTE